MAPSTGSPSQFPYIQMDDQDTGYDPASLGGTEEGDGLPSFLDPFTLPTGIDPSTLGPSYLDGFNDLDLWAAPSPARLANRTARQSPPR